MMTMTRYLVAREYTLSVLRYGWCHLRPFFLMLLEYVYQIDIDKAKFITCRQLVSTLGQPLVMAVILAASTQAVPTLGLFSASSSTPLS